MNNLLIKKMVFHRVKIILFSFKKKSIFVKLKYLKIARSFVSPKFVGDT